MSEQGYLRVVEGRGTMTIYQIDDLARPRLPLPMRVLNKALAPFAPIVRLDENRLLTSVMKKTGLTDFGDMRFLEPLHVLVDALNREADLNTLSRVFTRQLLLQLLTTRLYVQNLLVRHPEILNLPVTSPIVILGLPRTGTTHLHNLLACDPHLRSLPYWESLQPVLPPEQQPLPGQHDPRIKRSQQNLRLINSMMPLYPLMHDMAYDLPQEEIQLLAVDFSTTLFEWSNYVPAYRDWYCSHDQTPAYRYLRKMLQVLQWLRGGTRWVLKSPQHLEQLGPLLEVFPDAKIVMTHRDPVPVTASLCTMLAYVARGHTDHVDLLEVGRYWSARVEGLLQSAVRDAPLVPDEQLFHVRFHEFLTDEMTMVKRVYEFAEQPMTEDALHKIKLFKLANPRGKLGSIEYRLEDFGLDFHERRQALRFYQRYFDVPDE